MMSFLIPAPSAQGPLSDTSQNTTRLLIYAVRKLQDRNIPMSLKATAYLRLCCIGIQKLRSTCEAIYPEHVDEFEANRSYSEVLTALYQHDLEWWRQCWISDRNTLRSHDPAIDALVEPFGYFIEMFT